MQLKIIFYLHILSLPDAFLSWASHVFQNNTANLILRTKLYLALYYLNKQMEGMIFLQSKATSIRNQRLFGGDHLLPVSWITKFSYLPLWWSDINDIGGWFWDSFCDLCCWIWLKRIGWIVARIDYVSRSCVSLLFQWFFTIDQNVKKSTFRGTT